MTKYKIIMNIIQLNVDKKFNLINYFKILFRITKLKLKNLKENWYSLYTFIKLLCIYLIEKYYYKYNVIYFIIKANSNTQIFNFFITLIRVKDKFIIKKPKTEFFTAVIKFYIKMFFYSILVCPLTWDFLRWYCGPASWRTFPEDSHERSLCF